MTSKPARVESRSLAVVRAAQTGQPAYVDSRFMLRRRADLLAARLMWMGSQSPGDEHQGQLLIAVARQLDEVTEALRIRNPFRRLISSWTGRGVESAALKLDLAEENLLQASPPDFVRAQIPELLAGLDTLQLEDPRRADIERILRDVSDGPLSARQRGAAVRAAGLLAEQRALSRARVRSFRNVLLLIGLVLSSLSLGLVLLGILRPSALNLCFSPGGSTVCPAGATDPSAPDLAVVELLGALGGALGAILSLRNLAGASRSFAGIVAATALKLPAGALFAVAGLLAIRGGFVPGLSELDKQLQILGYAVVFGFAQQLLTRTVDNQLLRMNEPASTPGGKPGAAIGDAVHTALVRELAPPRLINYEGILTTRLTYRDGSDVDGDGNAYVVEPGRVYRLNVTVASGQYADDAAGVPIRISEGDRSPLVPFTVGIVGDVKAAEGEEVSFEVPADGSSTVALPVKLTDTATPRAWLRLTQHDALIQVIPVSMVTTAGAHEQS